MGKEKLNLIGLRVGKLVVVEFHSVINYGTHWVAQCDCGKKTISKGTNLNRGLSTSCGCNRKGHRFHGISHPLHKVWLSMRSRCNNPKSEHYYRYGGRGIKVCERWNSYENFYNDVFDGYQRGLQLDRFPNNDGDYEPSNFRWATRTQNMRNSTVTKINEEIARVIKYSSDSAKGLSEIYGVSKWVIWDIRSGKTWKNI